MKIQRKYVLLRAWRIFIHYLHDLHIQNCIFYGISMN